MYPEWVEKYHGKCTSIREVGGRYYLYRVSSSRVKGKSYPVCRMEYLGRITEEGLIKPVRTSFTPGADKIIILSSAVEDIPASDRKILDGIGVIEASDRYYSGKLTARQIKTVEKYFCYDNGIITERE